MGRKEEYKEKNLQYLQVLSTQEGICPLPCNMFQVFYRDVMYREGAEGKDEAYLKLYDGHDWKWSCVRLDLSLIHI